MTEKNHYFGGLFWAILSGLILGCAATVCSVILVSKNLLSLVEFGALVAVFCVGAVLSTIATRFIRSFRKAKKEYLKYAASLKKKLRPNSENDRLLSELKNLRKMLGLQQSRVIPIVKKGNNLEYIIPNFGSKANDAFFDSIAQAESLRRQVSDDLRGEDRVKIVIPSSISRLNKLRPYQNGNKHILPKSLRFPAHLINFN